MLKIQDGKVIDSNVTLKVFSTLEHGQMNEVHAIVVHQTGGQSSAGTLSQYENSSVGAHFLVDKDGTIYQTARVTQKCLHVGKIQSRCYVSQSCAPAEKKAIDAILYKKGTSYSNRVSNLSAHEMTKRYPERYPTNDDSIGIEVVGALKNGEYESPSDQQALKVKWLISGLLEALKLESVDVYRHPTVSYKQKSEAAKVAW